MSVRLVVGLLLALGSAAAINWAYVAQHGAVAALPKLDLRRPMRSLGLLLRAPRWLIAFFVGVGGWIFYVAALRLAPLSLVQAAAAGGIGLLALLVSRRGTQLRRAERRGVVIALVGLLLLGLSLGGHHSGARGSTSVLVLWMALSVAAAAVVSGPASRPFAPGAGLGAAAGILYAAGDIGTKAAVEGGIRLAFVPAVLACHALAFVALQFGFQRGGALATAGVATLWTNALPIIAGVVVFSEALPGGVRGVVRVTAFVAVVAAAVTLARREHAASRQAREETSFVADPSPADPPAT